MRNNMGFCEEVVCISGLSFERVDYVCIASCSVIESSKRVTWQPASVGLRSLSRMMYGLRSLAASCVNKKTVA